MKKLVLSDYMVEPKSKIAKRMVYQDKSVIAFLLNIAKGESLPNHTHFDSTVLVQVLKGTGSINVDQKTSPITTGDLIEVDGPENMAITNEGDTTLVLYVSISPAPPSEKYAMDADI